MVRVRQLCYRTTLSPLSRKSLEQYFLGVDAVLLITSAQWTHLCQLCAEEGTVCVAQVVHGVIVLRQLQHIIIPPQRTPSHLPSLVLPFGLVSAGNYGDRSRGRGSGGGDCP